MTAYCANERTEMLCVLELKSVEMSIKKICILFYATVFVHEEDKHPELQTTAMDQQSLLLLCACVATNE